MIDHRIKLYEENIPWALNSIVSQSYTFMGDTQNIG